MDPAPREYNTPSAPARLGFWAANARLVLALAAGALLTHTGGTLLAPATAEAQRSSTRNASGILNPADQRNDIIDELKKISSKLDKLEKAFDGTLDVNVLTMPAQSGNATNGD